MAEITTPTSQLVPGFAAFKSFKGVQPDIDAASTIVPIAINGLPTPGEQIVLGNSYDAANVQPDYLTYTVLESDSLASIATALAALIEAAITAGSNSWYTLFTASAATVNTVNSTIRAGVSLPSLVVTVGLLPSTMLQILPANYPEKVSTSSTEVTALSAFAFNGPSGVFRVYRNQRITVSNDIAQELISQGLAQ